jgi:hypothetical protein
MKFILFFLIGFFSLVSWAQKVVENPTCAPSTESCDYYLCKAQLLHCTESDYPVKFGYRLCQRYLMDQNQSSEALRAWLPAVRECLQEKFETLKVDSCQNIEQAAFATHVQCYVQTGFCHLSDSDKAWLVLETSWQMLYPVSMQTALEVQRACQRQ